MPPDITPPNPDLDAKQGATAPEVSSPSTDATETSSTSTDAKDSVQGDFADLATAATLKQHKDTEDSHSAPSPEKKEEIAKAVTPPSETTEKDKNSPGDDFTNLPFHKHERFQSLLKERDEARQQATTYKQDVERLSTIDSFCKTNGINGQQFKEVMEIAALLNTNPSEARKRLQPTIQFLAQFEGTHLPEDLAQEVEKGSLQIERAREIASLRTKRDFEQKQYQRNAQQTKQQAVEGALNDWEGSVKKSDPDYGRKEKLVIARFVSLTADPTYDGSAQAALRLANQAYKDVNEAIQGFIPQPKPTKTLNGHSSSASVPEPKSWDNIEETMVSRFAGKH